MCARLAWNPGYHSFLKWAIFWKIFIPELLEVQKWSHLKYFAESKREIGRIYDTAGNSEGFVEKVENLSERGVNDYGIPRA